MVAPTLTVRADWLNNGTFTDAIDSCVGRVLDCSWTRGASADFSGEATGSATLLLDNFDDRYTPDRNWHDNPSFEVDTTGWSVTAITSLTAAATSITKVADNAPSAGTSAGEAVLTATVNSGVTYAIPYRFRSGLTYAVSVYLKSMTGNLNVRAGLASSGTPADIASSGANITTSWAQYTFTWTPSADRTDGVFFVRTTTAAAATLRIDAAQVNPGATANTYIEAPTKGQLVPGRPVHIYTTYSAVDDPQFYGFIERLTPNPADRTVAVTCYDVLRRLQETDIVVAAHAFVVRSARDFRVAVLDDFERGVLNLVGNPEFATDTSGWSNGGGTLTRLTTDGPTVAAGTTCGEYVTTAITQRATYTLRLAPVFFAGQVYRASFYLRAPGAVVDIEIGIRRPDGTVHASRTITPTATWTRYSLTWTQPTTVTTSGTSTPFIFVGTPTTVGTIRVGAVSVTRGQALYPYAAAGTGRWPSWVGNGSFDGGALNGWYNGFLNYCTNPDFETNTTGWAVTADAFHTAATSITRASVSGAALGTWYADVDTSANGEGAHFAITGTFKSGASYSVRLGMAIAGTAVGVVEVGIGSNGTPADVATLAVTGNLVAWTAYTFNWTPSADRIDAHVYVKNVSGTGTLTLRIDAVDVIDADGARTRTYDDVNIVLPFATHGTTTPTISTTAKYGSKSHSWTSLAIAGSGRVYGLEHLGGYFVAGQPYTLALWLRASDAMPYRVGIAGALTGARSTWDSANTTGTLTANTWTKVTVTWTPSVDFPVSAGSTNVFQEIVFIEQTDAVSRTVYVDGVRAIPGSSADDYEMTHWSLAAESDTYRTDASLSGTALASLGTLNGYTLSRHWIEPTMAAPWYTYMTRSRDDLTAKASSETYADDLADMSTADIDRASIINVVPVAHSTGTDYYSDEASVGAVTGAGYGARPTGTIGSSAFFGGRTIGDVIGPALVARYKDPRARPTMTIVNRWPSQLQRELDDLITVTFARLRISNGRYLILRLTTTVSESAQRWVTTYALEEHSA